MKYKATESFTHDELGPIAKGDEVTATAIQAVTPLMLGYFKPVESKADDGDKPAAKAKK